MDSEFKDSVPLYLLIAVNDNLFFLFIQDKNAGG